MWPRWCLPHQLPINSWLGRCKLCCSGAPRRTRTVDDGERLGRTGAAHADTFARMPSATEALTMMQEAFGAYRAVVADCPEAVHVAAARRWRRCSNRSKPLLLDLFARRGAGRLGTQTQLRGSAASRRRPKGGVAHWLSARQAVSRADNGSYRRCNAGELPWVQN
jgi:hypothetical protein